MVSFDELRRSQQILNHSHVAYFSDIANRNRLVKQADDEGWLQVEIAAALGISEVMVHKILTKGARADAGAAREG